MNVEHLLLRLNEIGIALSSEQDLELLLSKIVRHAREFCRAEAGSLYLREDEALSFVVAQNDVLSAQMGNTQTVNRFKKQHIDLSPESLAGYVALTGEVLNIPDAYEIPADRPFGFNREFDVANGYRTRSMLLIPMRDPTEGVIGVLQLINARDDGGVVAFDPRYESLVSSLASQAAVSVRNARLTSALKRAYQDTIVTLSVAAEFRDKDTAAHIKRMSHYCYVIAQELGLSDTDCESILFASPMHDVGKIGVPDAILLKPGKLTDDEYRAMQKHTLYGERILANSDAPILTVSKQIAATHHEKWDGTGYPRRLAGDAIPLFGRIAALADVYDALVSRRCYKDPMPIERALEIIDKDTGTHFDPTVVGAFMRGLQRVLYYMDQFADENLDLGSIDDSSTALPATRSTQDKRKQVSDGQGSL